MKEYIEREALPKKKERGFFHDDDFNAGWNACLNAIASIPTADVVEKKRNFIDGANLASKIAGHSYYHGDAILSAIFTLMNGKGDIASIKPADELKFFYADWLWDGYDYRRPWVCSKCHYHSESGTNYCPNCGAKMDGGLKNDDNI